MFVLFRRMSVSVDVVDVDCVGGGIVYMSGWLVVSWTRMEKNEAVGDVRMAERDRFFIYLSYLLSFINICSDIYLTTCLLNCWYMCSACITFKI